MGHVCFVIFAYYYRFRFMFSKFYDSNLLILLALIAFVWLFLIWRNRGNQSSTLEEGFQQDSPYVLKQGADVYDDFYAQFYQEHIRPHSVSAADLVAPVIQATMPSVLNSRFLDVGCGTGAVLDAVSSAGYSIVGVDRSKCMIEYASSQHDIRHADVADPMLFDARFFSHILLIDQVVYEWTLDEMRQIFKNCSHWLQRGGYFVLHLVDPKYHADVVRDFGAFTYSSKYKKEGDVVANMNTVVHIETFTDHSSQHMRSNENVLHMSSVGDILKLAEQVGFHLQAKWVIQDHQFVYLLSLS